MTGETRRNDIPYFEYRAINQIVHEHLKTLGDTLRAVIAFGPMVTSGDTHDIDLLEVIENWQGPSRLQSESSANLPMRGKLYLNFLSLQDFLSAASPSASQTLGAQELIGRVLDGCEIIYEQPAGFARGVIAQATANLKQRQGGELLPNPLELPLPEPSPK